MIGSNIIMDIILIGYMSKYKKEKTNQMKTNKEKKLRMKYKNTIDNILIKFSKNSSLVQKLVIFSINLLNLFLAFLHFSHGKNKYQIYSFLAYFLFF